MPEVKIFVELVESLEARGFLTQRSLYTVFAPTDAAVEAYVMEQDLPENWRDKGYLVKQLVLHHIISSNLLMQSDILHHGVLGTMNGQDLTISRDQQGNILLGGRGHITAVHNASNGIIHTIDVMLKPPVMFSPPVTRGPGFGQDRYNGPNFGPDMDVLGQSHNITLFLTLLNRTQMAQELFSDSSYGMRGFRFRPFHSRGEHSGKSWGGGGDQHSGLNRDQAWLRSPGTRARRRLHNGEHGPEMDSTVFAPTDEAFNQLLSIKLEELMKPGNLFILQEFIAHHVLPEERDFEELWPGDGPYVVPSLQGSDLRLACQDVGKLYVNERSRVIGVGLEFEGGVVYPVTQVIALPRMEGRCDKLTTHTRRGHCKRCNSMMCPPQVEQVGEVERGCRFKTGWYNSVEGCQANCQFKEVVRSCCAGYYGRDCQECPGGPNTPCSDHGTCNDGAQNDGRCICKPGFMGTACERCLPDRYGPSCKACSCANSSTCVTQTGQCFCPSNFEGQFCDIPISPPPICTPSCPWNAVCRPGNQCQCLPAYHGDGHACSSDNRCFEHNGGCSIHANCFHNATAISIICTCHDGYHGDGIICLPINRCKEDNGGCHPNATCHFRGANAHTCICKPPYWGNGIQCQLSESAYLQCVSDHGGCSVNAVCIGYDAAPDEVSNTRQCRCLPGYVGNGFFCNGNTYDTIAGQPDFYQFNLMLIEYATENHDGSYLINDLMTSKDPHTVLIPLNHVNGTDLDLLPSQAPCHVIRGNWSRDNLQDGIELQTWSGEEVEVQFIKSKDDSQVHITINRVRIVAFDIPTTNGIIHIIEKPLTVGLRGSARDGDMFDNPEMSLPSSHIFAAVVVPIGVLAFAVVAALFWLRRQKLRNLVSHVAPVPRRSCRDKTVNIEAAPQNKDNSMKDTDTSFPSHRYSNEPELHVLRSDSHEGCEIHHETSC